MRIYDASFTFQAVASPRLFVALKVLRPILVAVAWSARAIFGVSPVVGETLVALPASEALLALALAGVQVTGRRGRPDHVTVAILATFATGNLPVVLLATAGKNTHHIHTFYFLASQPWQSKKKCVTEGS